MLIPKEHQIPLEAFQLVKKGSSVYVASAGGFASVFLFFRLPNADNMVFFHREDCPREDIPIHVMLAAGFAMGLMTAHYREDLIFSTPAKFLETHSFLPHWSEAPGETKRSWNEWLTARLSEIPAETRPPFVRRWLDGEFDAKFPVDV